MKIGILTQFYPPEIGAPQARLSEIAQRLKQRGHTVIVLTAMPNYPTGKIHPGYGGILKRETRDDIRIIRTIIYPTQKASFLHRLTNYFSFVLSSAIIGTFFLPRLDYLFVESTPLFTGLSGYWLSRIKGAKMIFNVSDLWPENAVVLGLIRAGSMSHRISLWLEKFCYQKAWLITGQSKSILSDIKGRFPKQITHHLSNGVDVKKFGPECATVDARAKLVGNASGAQCVALYAGLHGLAQGLDQVLETADRMKGDLDLRFVLLGDGPEKSQLVEEATSRKLTNVRFLDPVPSTDIPPLVASADIILVTIKMFIPGMVPSKLYEAMASSKPVIMVAEGEAADIVRDNGAGIAVKPGDINGLVEALRTLHQQPDLRARMAAKGRRAAELYFNRDKIAAKFGEYLETGKPVSELQDNMLIR
jgi:colanic acid biosynthesis glycosyl transferase WcaI